MPQTPIIVRVYCNSYCVTAYYINIKYIYIIQMFSNICTLTPLPQLAMDTVQDIYKHYHSSSNTIVPTFDEVVGFTATIALVPIKVTPSVFKVLAITPGMSNADIEVKPCYVLVRHGRLSHAYSLINDPNTSPSPQRSIEIKPLAEYFAPSRHPTHARIIDYSRMERPSDPALNIKLYYVGSHGGHAEVVTRTSQTHSYRWKHIECPPHSDCFVYAMHQIQGPPSQRPKPVAVVRKAPFKSPVDNSALVSIEVDAANVSPITAFLAYFAGAQSPFLTVSTFLASSTSKLSRGELRAPTPLHNIVFGTLNDPNEAASKDPDQSPQDSTAPLYVKTLNSYQVSYYDMSTDLLQNLQAKARVYILAMRTINGLS
uniref:ARAD1D48092p n=1 Tax=Blastobotrys adeninivorans TaxID=409370 RepID=A0A060TDI8_BLAAD